MPGALAGPGEAWPRMNRGLWQGRWEATGGTRQWDLLVGVSRRLCPSVTEDTIPLTNSKGYNTVNFPKGLPGRGNPPLQCIAKG